MTVVTYGDSIPRGSTFPPGGGITGTRVFVSFSELFDGQRESVATRSVDEIVSWRENFR